VERVHPDGVSRRLGLCGRARRLQHTELRLQVQQMAPEDLERVVDLLLVEPLLDDSQVLDSRKRRQGPYGDCSLRFAGGYGRLAFRRRGGEKVCR
jgi:hypothetical protein